MGYLERQIGEPDNGELSVTEDGMIAYTTETPGRTLVGAEIDSCDQPPGHPPHLRRSMVWSDSMDRRQRWLYCLGGYDQQRQLNAVTVDLDTDELVEEGAKPWEHPKTPEAGWDPEVRYQHWDQSVGRWT